MGNILKRKRRGKSKVHWYTQRQTRDVTITVHIAFFFSQIRDSRSVQNFRPLFVGSVTAWLICPPGFIKTAKLMSLLHPFRNYWWSLTIWLAISSVINSRIALFSAINRAFSQWGNEKWALKQNNQPDFEACLKPRTNEIAGKCRCNKMVIELSGV